MPQVFVAFVFGDVGTHACVDVRARCKNPGIEIATDAVAASCALAVAAIGCRMVGGERLHVAEKIDRRGIAPFDPNNLGTEGRQDARGLRADLQPGQVDNSNAVECAAFFSGIISHLPSPSS